MRILRRRTHSTTAKWLIAAGVGSVVGVYLFRNRPRLGKVLGTLNGITYFLSGRTDEKSPEVSVRRHRGVKIEESIAVNRSPRELYAFWRNLENLPLFLKPIKSIHVTGAKTSHWVTGLGLEWDAEIHNEVKDELIGWRSLEGSDVNHAGSVHFRSIPGTGATRVRVILSYEPPAGAVGEAIVQSLGMRPKRQLRLDLKRFKELMEFSKTEALEAEEEAPVLESVS